MPRPHLGFSDHTCILLVPTHCPVLKNNKPTQKTVTVLSAPTGRYSGKQQLMRAGWTWRTPLRIKGHFATSDSRSMWKGIKSIMDSKKRDADCPGDPSLPDALNNFYARFESSNSSHSTRFTVLPGKQSFSVPTVDVGRMLRGGIDPQEAAGPDDMLGPVLRDCAQELTEVPTDIFNTSLCQFVVPVCRH